MQCASSGESLKFPANKRREREREGEHATAFYAMAKANFRCSFECLKVIGTSEDSLYYFGIRSHKDMGSEYLVIGREW